MHYIICVANLTHPKYNPQMSESQPIPSTPREVILATGVSAQVLADLIGVTRVSVSQALRGICASRRIWCECDRLGNLPAGTAERVARAERARRIASVRAGGDSAPCRIGRTTRRWAKRPSPQSITPASETASPARAVGAGKGVGISSQPSRTRTHYSNPSVPETVPPTPGAVK